MSVTAAMSQLASGPLPEDTTEKQRTGLVKLLKRKRKQQIPKEQSVVGGIQTSRQILGDSVSRLGV